jgi:hypothetical protein
MISGIDEEDFHELKQNHLELVSQYPLINAVLSRVQRGFVYVDSARPFFFVCTKSGFSLANGPGNTIPHQEFLEFLLQNKEIPEYIHLYSPAASFQSYLEANWPKYKVRRRAQFRSYHRNLTCQYKDLLPAGYQIVAAQELNFEQMEKAFALNFANSYWNSKDDFLNKAIGACILTEQGEPVAICYSACIVDGIAEVDVLVLAEHRGKKFGRIVSEPFFNQVISRGMIAHWDTFIENSPSYLTIKKFGFTQMQEYDLVSVFLR